MLTPALYAPKQQKKLLNRSVCLTFINIDKGVCLLNPIFEELDEAAVADFPTLRTTKI
jgi:hypothetical protein